MKNEKLELKAGNMLYPLPVVMVSCGSMEKPNIITIAWAGTINTTPPMVSISIRPERYSHSLIKDSGVFTINLVNDKLIRSTDFCGVRSGKDVDKFKHCRLTAEAGRKISAPFIAESPLSIECVVKQIIPLGSHDMFIAEVVNTIADASFFNSKTQSFDIAKAGLVAYNHGGYYLLSEQLGRFGYSVKKK